MNREKRQDIERYIKERATDYFQPDKSGKGFICPICGSGSGKNGTGITENPKDKGHFTCWGGDCFRNADIFEIIGKQFNLTDFNEVFNKACEIFRVSTDEGNSYTRSSPKHKTDNKLFIISGDNVKDFTEFFKQGVANLRMTDYHRGISLETLKKFHVGFMPEWRVKPNAPKSPRLIIPNDGGGYLARDTRQDLTEQEAKYKKMRVGKIRLFNPNALNQTSKPVFIVEGEIDALSIIDAGGEAIALCSVANIGKLIEAMKEHADKLPPLIIQLDNDEAGEKARTKLTEALKELGFFSYRLSTLPEAYKDANEFLMNDREGFKSWIMSEINVDFKTVKEEHQAEAKESELAIIEEFDRQSMAESLNGFMERVNRNKRGGGIPTGFENLDKALDGGLYPGLYVIGANSSIGKTTFALQIGDYIAKLGRGVLIFSLEMARWELTAKILSRMSFIKSVEKYKTYAFAKTTREVLLADYWNKEDSLIAAQSVQEFSDWGQRLYTFEGIGDIDVTHIIAEVEKYVKYKKDSPVVIIDYLQILAPFDMKMTDKQNTDRNITELKRLSRDSNIPVIGISSFNRESYKQPVSMASFKESGAIEYSSDVLLAMQYNGWDYEENDNSDWKRQHRIKLISRAMEEAARERRSQDIQLKILKNRNGIRQSLFFEFFPAFNYFRPRTDEEC